MLKRRIPKERRKAFTDENYSEIYFELVYGRAALGNPPDGAERVDMGGNPRQHPFYCPDRDALVEAWEIFGDRALAEFAENHPGQRPIAWWILEHGKERPLIARPPAEQLENFRRTHTRFGYFHTDVLGKWPDLAGVVRWTYLQEPQIDYLSRLELISAQEQQAFLDKQAKFKAWRQATGGIA
jgi:hypothetical protein